MLQIFTGRVHLWLKFRFILDSSGSFLVMENGVETQQQICCSFTAPFEMTELILTSKISKRPIFCNRPQDLDLQTKKRPSEKCVPYASDWGGCDRITQPLNYKCLNGLGKLKLHSILSTRHGISSSTCTFQMRCTIICQVEDE